MSWSARLKVGAVAASLSLALGAVGPAPAAAADRLASAGSADVTYAQLDSERITFDDLRRLVVELEAEGGVTRLGSVRMQAYLRQGEWYYTEGFKSRAVLMLRDFKREASNPALVPSESARDQLVAAADQLIAQISSEQG